MPIRPRGRHWQIDVQVKGVRARETARTRAEAKEIEAALLRRLHEHHHAIQLGRAPRRLIEEAIEDWLTGDAQRLKSYRHILDHTRALLPYINGAWVDQIREVADKARRGMSNLKPATINQRLAILRRIANVEYEQGRLDKPVKIRLLPPRNARHIYLTIPQVHALADASGAARDAILLLAYTGLRRSELFNLTKHSKRDGCLILEANTKSSRPRTIPLAAPVKNVKIPVGITRQQLRARFEKARQATGMPHLHLHDLRHTTASLLVQAGASLTEVRDILGHSSFAVTNRYAHLAPEHLKAAIRRLSASHSRHMKKRKNVPRGT